MEPRAQLRQRPTPPAAASHSGAGEGEGEGRVADGARRKGAEKRVPAYLGLCLAAGLTLAVLYIIAARRSDFQPHTLWKKEELAKYNGSNSALPLLLAILGEVFDVSKGQDHYGPGKGYAHFTGRDATRAFVTGDFTGDLTDNVTDFTNQQVSTLEGWRAFYSKTYTPAGRVVGAFYDRNGNATEALAKVRRQIRRAAKEAARQKEDEARRPPCNSKWSQAEGGEVSCESGYPRKVFKVSVGSQPGQMTSSDVRCACIPEGETGSPDQMEYEGCPSQSRRCVTSPPEAS